MISFDKILWHVSSRYPGCFELQDRSQPVYHCCALDGPDSEVIRLDEATEGVIAKTIKPGVYEFTHTHCGQVVRISFNLWKEVRQLQPLV